MLTHQQIQHYRTFGWVVLPQFLTTGLAAALAAELRVALDHAHGHTRPGRWLPAMATATPISAGLLADDGRLWQASQQLVGDYTIPCPAVAAHLAGRGAWHHDDGIGVLGVRVTAYLERDHTPGDCLNLLPLSHTADVARIREYVVAHAGGGLAPPDQVLQVETLPGVAAPTKPGDLVAFDLHTWHAFTGHSERLLWATDYVARPMGPGADLVERRQRLRRWLQDESEPPGGDYDSEAWPVWRDWLANPKGSENRTNAIIRLELAGAFDQRGAASTPGGNGMHTTDSCPDKANERGKR